MDDLEFAVEKITERLIESVKLDFNVHRDCSHEIHAYTISLIYCGVPQKEVEEIISETREAYEDLDWEANKNYMKSVM
jgi:hypothetical protein